MKTRTKTNIRPGIALITVLFIVMAASIIALGIIVRSDMELACGKNMTTHMKMDYLAQSALTHAKTLLMYPQLNPVAGYWTGRPELQIDDTGDDYYDLVVIQSTVGSTKRLDYTIDASAYRLVGISETAKYDLTANLHLDPCITYWQGTQMSLPAGVAIYGDAYCDDNITIMGYVDGDVYSRLAVTDAGTITGNTYNSVAPSPVPLPLLAPEDFNLDYYIDAENYLVEKITGNGGGPYTLNEGPSANNPAGVYCYSGNNIQLDGNCRIDGTLVVTNDLTLTGTCSLTINAQKNFPALLVGGSLIADANEVSADITGLVQIGNLIDMRNRTDATVDVLGALYILGDGIINTTGSTVTVTTDPVRAAIKIDSATGSTMWTPTGGAIYKSINRKN